MTRKHVVGLAMLAIIALPTHADNSFSLMAGAGQGNFAWCGGDIAHADGGWRQPPLPYSDDRRVTAYLLGVRYMLVPNLALDSLYHHFTPVRVSGTYVRDDDYAPREKRVRPGAETYHASMETRTDGISISLVPIAHFGKTSMFGRLGYFLYKQDTEFSYPPLESPSLREAGSRGTWLLGTGIGHRFGPVTIAAEVFAFQQVKFNESPVGGDFANVKDFGLVNYMLTLNYKL